MTICLHFWFEIFIDVLKSAGLKLLKVVILISNRYFWFSIKVIEITTNYSILNIKNYFK